ncbi:concanavalin A-like lectin/glucanase domain-containing protein [Infundibulicybe gibba]|nr:concanavalin A-like lectin/glucanase domain-containing protein [Infundibulicybe gibba]
MKSLILLPLLLASVHAGTIQERQNCATYVIPGRSGGFTTKQTIDFSGVNGGNAATFLSQNGISISNYPISDSPVPHTFVPGNVALGAGTLNMKVNRYSGSGSIQSSEISTQATFQYASVRTVLKSSTTPGVVEGNFMYANDNQEVDFEILTTTTLNSSPDVPAGIWATNQALTPGQPSTHQTIPFTFDPSQGFHEYRIDWFSDSTTFFIDGTQKARLTSNVPTATAPWVWNSWSNGDPNWSNGPPTADSITQIRSIIIYKGFTPNVVGPTCNI